MGKRRYGDDEVREILSLATGDAQDHSPPAEAGGLTLDELQSIAREAGIDPARVAQAAETLDVHGRRATVRRSFGLPIAVSQVVDLPRAPTDREWDQLISEFRTAFGVHGRAMTTGGHREWSHGNLHISVEPTADGERLRLSDLKDDAVAINGLGFLLVAIGLVAGTVLLAAGPPGKALKVFGFFGGMSLLPFFGANLVRTPAWARERERQIAATAEHAVKLLSNS
jgi:hypothetical protein